MVSFHASLLPTTTMIQDSEDALKKRKRDGSLQPENFFDDRPSSNTKYSKRSLLDTELHLETPMPLEWQRCLDIKSGQIYYYNTRTQKKTSRDPRSSTPEELPKKNNMSLDLELNLPCGSSSSSHDHHTTIKHHHVADNFSKYKSTSNNSTTTTNQNNTIGGSRGGGGGGAPSWLALEGGSDQQQQEMVTAVCKKCHMLVMMFKSSPSCPNCKFMHPPNQTPPSLFSRELSLLC